MRFLLRLLLNGVALVIADRAIAGVHLTDPLTNPLPMLEAGVILGVINATIRPIIKFFSFPITVLTLGLFTLVINAVCFGLTAVLVPGFRLDGIQAAFFGALFVGVVSWLLSLVLVPKKD